MRKLLCVSVVALVLMLLCSAVFASFGMITFPMLVQSSDAIAVGKMDTSGKTPVLVVSQTLKGTLPQSVPLTMGSRTDRITFEDSEEVLLFLERAPKARYAAVVEFDYSKWPAPADESQRRFFDSRFADLKLNDLVKVVPKLADALCRTGNENVVNGIASLLKSKERLLWSVGLEEAMQLNFSGALDEKQTDIRERAAWILAALALPYVKDSMESSRAIHAAYRSPASVAVPILLARVDDADYYRRRNAHSDIKSILIKAGLSIASITEPSEKDTEETRAQAKAALTALWDTVKEKQLAEDSKVIEQRIKSKWALEKECALIYKARLTAAEEEKQ